MGQSLKYCMYDMYADDSTFYVIGENIMEINDKLTDDMNVINTWCKANKMVMNTDKTKTMLLGSQQRLSKMNERLTVKVNECILENTDCEKLLGIYVDPSLTWSAHILYLVKVINSRIALLRRIRSFLDKDTCLLYYNGYILPVMDYCSVIWGTCGEGNIQKVIRLQKSAARVILGDRYLQLRSADIFDLLEWDTIDKRIREKRLTIMYKCLNGLAPDYLTESFQFTRDTHSYGLRSSTTNGLFIEGGRTNYHKRSFSYTAAYDWNQLPPECREAESLSAFKRKIKM